jgi:2,4-dichlorophenol 6-monooxygenase
VHHVRLGIDAEVDAGWLSRCRLEDGGALLIRPDQHIAWRCDGAPTNPIGELAAALHVILGHAAPVA